MASIVRLWFSFALVSLAPLSAAHAQSCTVPAPADHELHPVWGGETWATFSDGDGSSLRIWTGEEGGRIRVSHDAGATWQFADTPDDFTGSIFDIWFFPGGVHGFATGRGGHVLESDDGGLSWDYYGTQILDGAGDPASLWGVRSLADGVVLASGLWAFVYTTNYGATWTSVGLYDREPSLPGATLIPFSELELFRLDYVGTLEEGFVGCVGAEWVPTGFQSGHGVVFFTDSRDPQSNAGRRWWIVLDDADLPTTPGGPVMMEPWAVRYERGSTSLTSSVAYVAGGPGGNHGSRHYRSTTSGRTWSFGGDLAVTPYDVTSQIGGTAMIVGYSGRYWLRNPANGIWTEYVMPSPSTWEPTPGYSTGALEGASSFGTSGLIATGDFGSQRISFDLGASWSSMSDFYPTSEELEQRIAGCVFLPSAPLTGFLFGQSGRILRTTDGGCSFTDQTPTYIGPSLRDMDFGSASYGVAVGETGALWYSTDAGLTWTAGAFHPSTTFPPGLSAANINFKNVSTPASGVAWAVGNFSDGTPVVAYTRTSGVTWFLMNPPAASNLTLMSVDFADATAGLVVGYSGAGGGVNNARAFVASFNGVTLTWTDVSPSLAGSTRLIDVAVSGSPLSSATAVAVGDDGLALEWSGTSFTTASVSGTTPVDLIAVDVSPSGGTVLVGGTYSIDLSIADDKGFLLRRDSGGWETIRALTGKDIAGISLTSDTEGYVAGQAGGDSASFINGNLASSILLRYLAEE